VPLKQPPLQQSERLKQPWSPGGMQSTHVFVVVSQMPEQHCEPLVQPLSFGRQHALLAQTWPLPVQAVVQLPQ
jgi:hypothetical protein